MNDLFVYLGPWLPLVICALGGAIYFGYRWFENWLHRKLVGWDQSRPDHPIFKSLRADQFRLGQEGFVINTEGFVECATCGLISCGQCGNADRIGLHILEYKERYWK